MIQYCNVENFTRFSDLLGEIFVSFTRYQIARWVVVTFMIIEVAELLSAVCIIILMSAIVPHNPPAEIWQYPKTLLFQFRQRM